MKKIFLSTAWVIFLSVSNAGAQTAAELYESGRDKYNNKQFDKAIEDLTKAIELKPDYWEAYRYRGVVKFYRKLYTAAIPDYNRAIELKPDNFRLYNERGDARCWSAQYAGGMQDYQKGFSLYHLDAGAEDTTIGKMFRIYGYWLIKFSEPDTPAYRSAELIKIIFKPVDKYVADSKPVAITSLPDSAVCNLLLDSAIVYLNIAIDVAPLVPEPWLLLGNAYYKRKHDLDKTVGLYRAALDYGGENFWFAFYNLGIIYNEKNKHELAEKNLLKAAILKPEDAACKFLLAQVYAKLNNRVMVEYWLREGEAIRPASGSDYYHIGVGFGKVAQNLNMAIVYLTKAVETDPATELYYEDLSVAYGMNGDDNRAISVSEKLIKVNPDYAPAYLNLSISYQNKGNIEMADKYKAKYNELTRSKK